MQTKHAHTTCGHFYMYLLHVHMVYDLLEETGCYVLF